MPNPWNDSTDRKLLLSIIHLQAPAGAPKWDQVAGLMGEGFTAESTRQHFQAMRKKSAAEFGASDTPCSTPAKKGSPRKTKANKGETPSKAGRKRKAAAEEDDDAESSSASPTKKQDVKTETEGDNE